MIYRFYNDIDWLTDVLALHERNIANRFDKVSANLEDLDRRYLFYNLAGACGVLCTNGWDVVFVLILLATIINTEVNIIQRIVHKNDLDNLTIINNEHHRLLDSSIIMH